MRFLDKVSEEMGLWLIETFHAALRDNAAIIGLHDFPQFQCLRKSKIYRLPLLIHSAWISSP